jgi:hypothetical protein
MEAEGAAAGGKECWEPEESGDRSLDICECGNGRNLEEETRGAFKSASRCAGSAGVADAKINSAVKNRSFFRVDMQRNLAGGEFDSIITKANCQ